MTQPLNQPTKPTKRVLFTAKPNLAITRKTFAATPAKDGAEAVEAGEQITLTGYAILWNALSSDCGGFKVRFLQGSPRFTTPTLALFHHNYQAILGNTGNETLRIIPDEIGIKVEIDLPNTTQAADVAELVEDKYVTGMSFSMLFDDVLVTTTKTESGVEIMEVSAFTCDEVTVTAIPSFTATTIGVQEPEAQPDEPLAMARNTPAATPDRTAQALRLASLDLAMRILE
jgi:hypothetical protein